MVHLFTTSLEVKTKPIISKNIEQFAFMDTSTSFMSGSCWRSSEGLRDIKEHLYLNIADVYKVIYNEERSYTLLLFNKEISYCSWAFNAIKFYAKDYEMKIYFLCNGYSIHCDPLEVMEKFPCSAKEMFKLLCILPKLQTKYAFISLRGNIYPSNYLCNYVSSEDKSKLREIPYNYYD